MSQFISQLKLVLKQNISDLEKLSHLLSKEKELLKTRNSQEIDALTKQKSSYIAQLDKRSKQKAKLFASSGLGIRPGKVEESLKTLKDTELMELWNESRQKLAHCKDQNLVNGAIINRSKLRVNRLMDIIRGKSKTPNLYGQQGKTQTYGGNQRIAKA